MKSRLEEAVAKVIEEQYGMDKIKQISYLSSGRINSIFKVELKDCDRDSVVVRLRYFNDPEFGQRFGTEVMCDEILQKRIKYPELIAYDSSRTLIPCDYSILSFADGRLFSTEDEPAKYEQLGRIVRTIHTAPVPEKHSRAFLADIDGYYKKRFEGIIANSPRFDKKVYELVKDAMQYYYPGIYTRRCIINTS